MELLFIDNQRLKDVCPRPATSRVDLETGIMEGNRLTEKLVRNPACAV